MIPVYFINGFLESGKTEFIKYTIAQPYFLSRKTTLLIVCEEGELEYEESLLKKTRTVMEVIDDEDDFTVERLLELEKKHSPERKNDLIFISYETLFSKFAANYWNLIVKYNLKQMRRDGKSEISKIEQIFYAKIKSEPVQSQRHRRA